MYSIRKSERDEEEEREREREVEEAFSYLAAGLTRDQNVTA